MVATKYISRPIPTISLASFPTRLPEITAQLTAAAEHEGFFSIIDHGIPTTQIEAMFAASAAFFALPDAIKATVPFSPAHNAGWEQNAQVRASTGQPDCKESYQMQFGANMAGRWLPDDQLPGFRDTSIAFMHAVQRVSEQLMVCLARGLGFADDFFVRAHDVTQSDSQSVARLLHYFEMPAATDGKEYHRAGAHTDWGFLTLLFQRAGQNGLEICPGRDASTAHGHGDVWTKVEPDPKSNTIICNIGDLLMSWSDDRFKSTFHRVKTPSEDGDCFGERYSIAYFNQPCKSVNIQGPGKKYPELTGEQFTKNAMEKNYRALLAARQERETA
ncbi:hypothetical protein FH972_021323 [Carpinus fangiana]|uniref:Fe2OG dioxygenase domain-containing protein n=1 Tax=Carpinus fangiana TaxID=176857 RepID=A0A5N6KPK3_9ROSI|nr:hypothetical protein FH972_021323 [Carpinus fangiana]